MSKYLPVIRHETNPEILNTKISCVYFLFWKGEIVYIGQTHNLVSRICNHKSKLLTCNKFDHFRYIECSEIDRVRYEKRWIAKFKPSYNLLLYRNDGSPYQRRANINQVIN